MQLAEPTAEPTTVTVTEAARLLGISKSHAYELIGRGQFPIPVLRLGARVVVPAAPLRRLLGGERAGHMDDMAAFS